MTRPIGTRMVRTLMTAMDSLALAADARVLALGSIGPEIVAHARARGLAADAGPERDVPDRPPQSLDLVVVGDFLEHLAWDRWALQRIHALLAPGGFLVLAVPNALGAARLASPRHVAAMVEKQFRKLARLSRRAPAPGAIARGYRRGRLAAVLESLGFETRSWSGRDGGAPVPLESHFVVVCRRLPSLFGITPERPFPNPESFVQRFEASHRAFVDAREALARELGADPGGEIRFDPRPYAGRSVLVLAPHPDDEIIGCGGTLLSLVAAGARLTVLYVTDGAASAGLADQLENRKRTQRLEEARVVAAAAGFSQALFWGEDNRDFRFTPELATRLASLIAELGPELIFTPSVTDIHGDHATVGRILAKALAGSPASGAMVAQYEVWGLVPANTYWPVSDLVPRLESLLFLYRTEMQVDDYVHQVASRGYYQSLRVTGAPGFVEVFFTSSPAVFRRMVERRSN